MIDFKKFYKRVNFDVDYQVKEKFIVKQNDTRSRGFYVKIIQDNKVVTPSQYEKLTFYGLKSDGTHIFQDAVLVNGVFRIDLPNQTFTSVGNILAEFSLRGSNNEVLSTKDFIIEVNSSFPVDPIESTDSFSALQQALSQIAGFAGEIQDVQLYAENIMATVGDISNLTTVQKDNLVNAVNELKSNIDSLLNSEQLETLLGQKVDKSTLGDMANLKTTEKTVLINAFNELYNSVEDVKNASNSDYLIPLILSKAEKATVGELSDLVDFYEDPEDNARVTSIVAAVNELHSMIQNALDGVGSVDIAGLALAEDVGDKSLLTTDDKTNLVNAVNEVNAALKVIEGVTNSSELSLLISGKADKSTLGNLANLTTAQKGNIVAAINEISASLVDKTDKEIFDAAVSTLQNNIDNIELTPGPPGQPGTDGDDGLPGTDGKSAYELWIEAGNAGTEKEFLDSLKGEDGIGTDGVDGKSAYQVWIEAGNTGTEQEFLDSLKGEGSSGSVISVNGQAGDVVITAQSIGALDASFEKTLNSSKLISLKSVSTIPITQFFMRADLSTFDYSMIEFGSRYSTIAGGEWDGSLANSFSRAIFPPHEVYTRNEESQNPSFWQWFKWAFGGLNGIVDMSSMFEYAKGDILELPSFSMGTHNVTNMSWMFASSTFESIILNPPDYGYLDTSKVSNMTHMFADSKCDVLDLSKFNTELAWANSGPYAGMYNMFHNCSATVGYARTQADADHLNDAITSRPAGLTFIVKP